MVRYRKLILFSSLCGLLVGGVSWWLSAHRIASVAITRHTDQWSQEDESRKGLSNSIKEQQLIAVEATTESEAVSGLRVAIETLCLIGEFEKARKLIDESTLTPNERDTLLKVFVDELIPDAWSNETTLQRLWQQRDEIWEDRLHRRWQTYFTAAQCIESPYRKCCALSRGLRLMEDIRSVSSQPVVIYEKEDGKDADKKRATPSTSVSTPQTTALPFTEDQRTHLIHELEQITKKLKRTFINMDSWLFNSARLLFYGVLFPFVTVGCVTLTQKLFEGIGAKVAKDLIQSMSQTNSLRPNAGPPDAVD
jgi:hypothetical protein